MKKLLAMGMAVVMTAVTLTGCGNAASDYLLDEKYSDYVKLCDYKGVEATKVMFEITDAQVQEEIEMYLYDEATYDAVTDRGVEMGDYVNLDYIATWEGKELEDYSSEDDDIMVGEGYVYTEVEEALIGMKTGEEKTVEVTLTEEYADVDDVGKELSVKVTVNEISVENIPEYNEEYVKEYTDFDTTEEYEKYIRQELQEATEEEYKSVAVEEIMAYIVDNSEFDGYPQELYDLCKENYDSSNEYYASMWGMELEEYLDMYGLDEKTQQQEIVDNVNYELVIGAIAQAEGIKCTDKEISDFIKDIYEDYGYESEEEFSEDYTDEDVGYEIVYEKVIDFLYENATFHEISEQEYQQQQEQEYIFEEEGFFDDESLENATFLEDEGLEEDSDSVEEPEIQIVDTSEDEEVNLEVEDSSDTEEE